MTQTPGTDPWNFHDLHQSAQGPPRDLGWHFGHRGRTRSSALPRPPAPHLACCNTPPGATRSTGRPKPPPPACVVGTDLEDRSMMGAKPQLDRGKTCEHRVMRRLRLLRRRGASGGCPWRCGRHWTTRGSRWIWMGSGDWTFGSFWKSAEELGSMIKPLAKNMIRSQPVAPWGSYCTQLDVVESCRTDDPPSAGLCPRFPWPRWCHWHGVLWSLPARVGPCASD